jgi:hypothetical protein
MNTTVENEALERDNLLNAMMHEGIVEFTFEKLDGSKRVARGTLDLGIVPEHDLPSSDPVRVTNPYPKFYDMDNEGWRSYRPGSVVNIRGFVEYDEEKQVWVFLDRESGRYLSE